MKRLVLAALCLGIASCSVAKEDGVGQCESTIFSKLADQSFYRRVTTDVANFNAQHPIDTSHFNQRWVDIVYDTRDPTNTVVRHRHHCVFKLKDGKVGDLISDEDRNLPNAAR